MPGQEEMNRVIHKVLLAGIVVSMVLIGIGLFLTVMLPGSSDGGWVELGSLWSALRDGNPVALVELGLLVLIATPLVRIITALVLFTAQRDYRFVLISLVVLSMICLAIVIDF